MNPEKKKKSLLLFKAIVRCTPLIIKPFPGAFLLLMLLTALQGAAWGITSAVNQRLYDTLTDLAAGNVKIITALISAGFVTAVMLGQQILNGLNNFYDGYLRSKIDGQLSTVIHKTVARIPAQVFEDKEKLDDIEKAYSGKYGVIQIVFWFISVILFYGIYFTVMGAYLWNLKPSLIIALVFIFFPVILSSVFMTKRWDLLEKQSAPIRRQSTHYEDCLISREKMKETRLLGAYHFFKELYMDSLRILAQKEWDTKKKHTMINLSLNMLKAFGWIGIMWLLFDALMMGEITVGAFAAVFGSIGMLFGMLEEFMSRMQYEVVQNLGTIHNFLNLLDIKILKGDNLPPDFSKGISAKQISFTYPYAKKPAVSHISLDIAPGETLALVGENGSGKTTLVKLLMGLYTPDEGIVTVGGKDTAKTEEGALFSKTSAVFQNFLSYAFTLKDNAVIGHTASMDNTEITDDIKTVLINSGVNPNDKNTFPKGLDTMLSREFEGVDLSGGQWQRIAIARGLYKPHQFIVLDEPTAAIDPIEETRVYNRFYEISKDKTCIIVTHRLGSARIADRIAVLEDGKIIEIGTHEALYAAGGKYTKMWDAQAEFY